MKILVFSDSHHDINEMTYTIESETPEMVIHLGDNTNDALLIQKIFPKITVERVGGNCDFEQIESEKTIKIENKIFFITHGHRYWVKSNLKKIVEKGFSRNADVVLFGHTHKSYINQNNGAWVINPGSISQNNTRNRFATYARIIINQNILTCEIVQS